MTDHEERTHHSESDLITIGDLVVWHQMPFFSVRRLTQLNCPRWPMWDASSIARISKARMLDDTRDWYFPIIVTKEKIVTDNPDLSHWGVADLRWISDYLRRPSDFPIRLKEGWSSWSGIWHSSAQHASEKASPLPPITHLPHDWLHYSIPREDILASAGGLLLIKGMSGALTIRRRSKRLNPESISDTAMVAAATSNGRRRFRMPETWKRLLVCNPLTRECRELPPANCRLKGFRFPSWNAAYVTGLYANLLVNEEVNCYRVILTLRQFVVVYTSTTNRWKCFRFPEERPWVHASAYVGGRLYFADVVSTTAANVGMEPSEEAINAATVHLFEVNVEAGKWQFVQQYTLRKLHIPSLKFPDQTFSYDMGVIPYIDIVDCMGSLYAVLPAKVHDAWLIGEEQSHGWKSEALYSEDEFGNKIGVMPLCFYIIQLEGHGEDCGVLRIQVPLNQIDYHSRYVRLMALVNGRHIHERNWFTCEARGSVIWVACYDWLLSFDVVSGKSQTQIIPLDDNLGEEVLEFAYRPSLHMKP